MPFLTFQTVKSHRTLRQTIRLARAVEKLKKSQGGDKASSLDEEDKIRQEARYEMLQDEIYEGLILLHDSGSVHFDRLNNITENPVLDRMKKEDGVVWLESLKKDVYGIIRGTTNSASPQTLEWLERFLDAIEIVYRGAVNVTKPDPLSMDKQELLMEHYIKPNDVDGLHVSRTLDQYYYSALADTSRRDVDQVARRYQARRVAEWPKETIKTKSSSLRDRVTKLRESRKFPKKLKTRDKGSTENNKRSDKIEWEDDPGAKIAMVDQLWLWIVDDGKKSMITSALWEMAHQFNILQKLPFPVSPEVGTRRPKMGLTWIYLIKFAITSMMTQDHISQVFITSPH